MGGSLTLKHEDENVPAYDPVQHGSLGAKAPDLGKRGLASEVRQIGLLSPHPPPKL